MALQLTAVFLFSSIAYSCLVEELDVPSQLMEIDSLIVFSGIPPNPATVELERELIFRDSLLLDDITALEVDESGNIFVAGASWNRRQVHIFNSDGSYRDSLGGYGDKYGQFLEINRLQLIDGDLFVFDGRLNRVTTYNKNTSEIIDTVGLHLELNNLPIEWPGYHATPVAAWNDEKFLVAFTRDRNPAYEPQGEIHYYKVNKNGEVISDKILKQEDIRYLVGDYAGRPAPFNMPLSEKPLVEISGNGKLYSAFSDEFLIYVTETDGSNSHAYYISIERHQLDPKEIIHPRFSHNVQLLRVWESADYPENWPALYSLLTDDENRLWISTITKNRDELKWWIINDHTGKIVATFNWPFIKPIYRVKNESVYTVEKNKLGFKEVVKYKMIK